MSLCLPLVHLEFFSFESWKFSPTYLWTEWDPDRQLDIYLLYLSKIQKYFFLQKARLAEADMRFTFFSHRICNISFILKSFVGNQSIWHCKMSHLESTAFSPDQGYYKSWILPFISTSVCMYFTLVLQSLISFRILALT